MSEAIQEKEHAYVLLSEARALWDVDAEPLFPPAGGRPTMQEVFERVFMSNVATWRAVVEIDRTLYAYMKTLVENVKDGVVKLEVGDGSIIYIFQDGNAAIRHEDDTVEHFWATPDNPSIQIEYDDEMVDGVLSVSGRVGQMSFLVPEAVQSICDDMLGEGFMEVMDGEEDEVPARMRQLTARYLLMQQEMRNEFHELQMTQESWLKGLMEDSRPGVYQYTVMGFPVKITLT